MADTQYRPPTAGAPSSSTAPVPPQPLPPPVKIYNAVYSSVQVYECMIRGIAVMRRRTDSYVNATQILKVAGVDKGRRTKILEKDILTGKHEIVQGGYGKYQGTWIPLDKGRDIANQYGVAPLLAPLFDFTPSTHSLQALPVSTPLFSALHGMPGRSMSSSSFTGFPSTTFSRSPGPGGNPLAPPPIMPGSALRLLNQGRAQGLFTPSTSLLSPTLQFPRQVSPRPPSSGATPTPPPPSMSGLGHPPYTMTVPAATPGFGAQPGATPLSVPVPRAPPTSTLPSFTSRASVEQLTSGTLKRAHDEMDMMDVSMPDFTADLGESMPSKRPRVDNPSATPTPPLPTANGTSNGAYTMPGQLPQRVTPAPSEPLTKSAFLMVSAGTIPPSSPGDPPAHPTRFSTKVSPIYTRDAAPLKDARRAGVINMICQSDDAQPILDTLKGVGNAGLSYISPNAENTFDPDTPLDASYHTALHIAASLSRINTVSILLVHGADAHKGNHLGETALIRSVLSSNAAELQSLPSLLAQLGATVWTLDAGGRSVLHHICAVAGIKGRAHVARYYMDAIFTYIATKCSGDYKSLVDLQDEHGDTALLVAARVGNRGIVRCLLDVGADVTLGNKLGLRAGDFGVGVEELNVSAAGRMQDRLSALRPNVSLPVQKSQDVIADMTQMIQDLSEEFQKEIKAKQDQLDLNQAHLRAAARELSEQRRNIHSKLWQDRCGDLAQAGHRSKNLQRALDSEDDIDWTGRIRPSTPPPPPAYDNIDPTLSMTINTDKSVSVPSAFAYRGSKAALGKVPDMAASDPIPIPEDNSLATLIKLRRMKLWYTRVNEIVKNRLEQMKGDSAEREFLCRKIVAICTGLSVQDVESRLDDLVAGLEVDRQNMDVARISGFMHKVQGT